MSLHHRFYRIGMFPLYINVILILQWLAGLVMFLFPLCSKSAKATYKFPHVFWGSAIYGLAAAACVTGAYGQVLIKLVSRLN